MRDFSLRQTVHALARGWQSFFHAPCDARICAAIRIGYALLVLINLATLYPDLDRWFTDAGVLPVETAQRIANPHVPSLLWVLPSTSAVVHVCFWIMAVHAALLLMGLLSNINAALVFVWLLSFQARNIMIFDASDTALRMLGFFAIWMPIGTCWSLDAVLASRRKNPHSGPLPEGEGNAYAAPGWALRLLQIQMGLIFFSTGLVKLDGQAWVDGTALYYVARLDDFFGRFPVPAWAFDTPWPVALMTWAVILVELAVPLLIWFRETRRLCLVSLLLFHLANEWSMHLFLFHWTMLVGWLSFLSPDDWASRPPLRGGARRQRPEPSGRTEGSKGRKE